MNPETQSVGGVPAFLRHLPRNQPLLGIPAEAFSPLACMRGGIPSALSQLNVASLLPSTSIGGFAPYVALAVKPLGFLESAFSAVASQQHEFPPLANIANGSAFQQADDTQTGHE